MPNPNPWQPTTSENLPWGEVVEVRWNDCGGDNKLLEPCIESGVEYWFADGEVEGMYWIDNTEWRHHVGMDKDGG